MAKTKAKTIQLSSPIQKLVDELGAVYEQRKILSDREEVLKTELRRHGAGVFDGIMYSAMAIAKERTFYKTELLKINVNEDVLEKCKVLSAYLEIKVARRTTLQLVK